MDIKKIILGTSLAVVAMAASVSAKDYSGAELYMLNEVQYGKFEARMQMAAVSGTVSSMFLYQNGSEIADGRPWVEVDIEVLGKNPSSFQSNIITGKAGAQKTSEKHHQVNPATTQAFHTYGLEWTPNYVRWTVDGVEVRKTEGGQATELKGTQGLRFNLWSSEDPGWVGNFNPNDLPIFQFINWVKVYKYTPGQGENGSDFTLDWTDNFDTFDGSRWGKGDWTFDGNRVDLTDKNIYSKDGMLILALTRKGQEMFNGQVPVDNEPAPQVSSSSQQQQSSASVQPQSSASVQPQSSASVQPQSSASVIPQSSASVFPQSSAAMAIQPMRTEAQQLKEPRGIVNAKGAHVKDVKNRYRVNFKY